MTATATPDATRVAVPSRFREAERRGRRMGRMLRLFGHLDGAIDEALMGRIAAALLERDEPAAALGHAIRMRAGEPGRVTHAQLRAALEAGPDGPAADAPPALADFMSVVTAVPQWTDWQLLQRGTEVFARLGRNAADVLLQLSLIGGYRFGGPTDLLAATGGLTGRMTQRRLAETQEWAASLSSADALRPGGAGWRATVHVRVMHAMVNSAFEPKWDVARWGLPINQADAAGTLGLFDGALLIGCRALGVPIPRGDAHALMHMWRYVGWLMGVHPDFLTDDEHERHRINYHLLVAAADLTEAGPQLARAALEVQRHRYYGWWPAPLRGARGSFERERLLSMLTGFLGPRTMRRLGLPVRPPWAFGYLLPLNTVRYRVLDRLPGGTARRDAWGKRVRDRILASYFGPDRDPAGSPASAGRLGHR